MIFFTTHEIEQWIAEDAPLVDLTSHLLGIDQQPALLEVSTRQPTCLALMEEARRIFELLDCRVTHFEPSGKTVAKNTTILRAQGASKDLHRGWKVAMNLLETQCGVATHTAEMVKKVSAVSDIPLLVTRKHTPGLKKLLTKSILAGGAHPHRLGLSETILIFQNHLNLIGGRSALVETLASLKSAAVEKKIAVECETLDQALQAVDSKMVDVIQFDKVPIDTLQHWCQILKRHTPAIKILVAGGLNSQNIQAYAQCGVDGLVLSSLYHAPPADFGVTIQLVE